MKACLIVLVLFAVGLAVDTLWVNCRTRPAAARDGGAIIDTYASPHAPFPGSSKYERTECSLNLL